MSGRNSIANEIEPSYVEIARKRIEKLAKQPRMVGATEAEVIVDGATSTERVPAVSRVQAHL
jgi:DNA modification methylase